LQQEGIVRRSYGDVALRHSSGVIETRTRQLVGQTLIPALIPETQRNGKLKTGNAQPA
jgi:hypothetical protein